MTVPVDTGYPEDAGFCGACVNLPSPSITLTPSFSDLLGEEITEDEFQREASTLHNTKAYQLKSIQLFMSCRNKQI